MNNFKTELRALWWLIKYLTKAFFYIAVAWLGIFSLWAVFG
jgi:hypothetical protein